MAKGGQKPQFLQLQGGLDLVTPAALIRPGRCIASLNYEVEARGYTRITGHERTDGQNRPSDAEYYLLDFDAGLTAVLEDDHLIGVTSGATGYALVDAVLDSGAWDGTGAGTLVLYNVVGTFQDNEPIAYKAAILADDDGDEVLDEDGAFILEDA